MEKDLVDRLHSRTTILVRSGFSCGVGTELNDFSDNGLHDTNFVFSWILRGDGTYLENGTTATLCDGCVCMRRPGREYVMQLAKTGGLRLFLTIPSDSYTTLCRLIPEIDGIPSVWKQPFTREGIEAFCTFYDHMEAASSFTIYTLLPEMIQYILRLTGIQHEREKDPLTLAKGILSENWSLSLEAIAERCGMAYNTFRKRFTEAYGISPGRYRIRQRITEAGRLLSLGMPVARVAVRLGYPDVYSFTHQFTSVMGIPPGQYAQCYKNAKKEQETESFL